MVVLILLLVLKWLFPVYGSIGFDLLFWLISVMGAYEFMRAVGNIEKWQYWTVLVTCALIIPSFVLTKYLINDPNDATALVVLMLVACLGAMATATILVFDRDHTTLRSTAYAELCIMYCGALASVSANINHLAANSLIAITMMFLITVGVDSLAFIVGSLLGKRFPRKLAPHTSPNKTVVGAIGGILGGVIAAVVVYFIFNYLPVSSFAPEGYSNFTITSSLHPCLVLILISIPTAVAAQLGDLFESAIKRECGIKDMGKILPGHGGVLDRFDSMLFTSVVIAICFMFMR
jgi:phosphatidate cytidylyltransferase